MNRDSQLRSFTLRSLAVAIGLGAGASSAAPAPAANPVVTNLNDQGPGSLRQALLDATNDGGEPSLVTFAEGLAGTISLGSPLPQVDDSIEIQGAGITLRGPDDPAGDPALRFAPSQEEQMVVSGLTITGSRSGAVGAVFQLAGGSLVLDGVTLTKNSGASAVRVTGGALEVRNSEISFNDRRQGNDPVFGYGGGISVSSTELLVEDSLITGNAVGVQARGGGIQAHNSDVVIRRSEISDNLAGSRGGGLFFYYFDSVLIEQSTITGNTANNGAGIDAYAYGHGTFEIRGSSITGNRVTAGLSGGQGRAAGLRFDTGAYGYGEFRMIDTVIEGNIARYVAGLDVDVRDVQVERSLIRRNIASEEVGGLRIRGNDIHLLQSSVTGNQAPDRAAGEIRQTADDAFFLRIGESTVSGHLSEQGSVLQLLNGYQGDILIENSTFSGNTASGPVLEIDLPVWLPDARTTVQNSTFSGNDSTGSVAALLIDNQNVTIEHSTFVDNQAVTSEGASSVQLQWQSTLGEDVSGALVRSVFTSSNGMEARLGSTVTLDIDQVIMANGLGALSGALVNGAPIQTSPALQPMGYRGGFTLVHEPEAVSPAVDGGSLNPRSESRDQRGLSGNVAAGTAGALSDLGAVEVVANTAPRLAVDFSGRISGVRGTEVPAFALKDLFVDDQSDAISTVNVHGLPPGLSFNEGNIAGTLTTPGRYFVTAILTDNHANPLRVVEQFVVTVKDKKSSSGSSGGSAPMGLVVLLGFLARLRRPFSDQPPC